MRLTYKQVLQIVLLLPESCEKNEFQHSKQ